ncbi:MAG: hypothetical protein BAJALOKI1v1_460010 [Promethearchaeota archaeon]|nr:MAG: hypothetical protein BAJALOKI1v1_460010 [Candidatus Lokiarchaeota archaeon]
MRARRGEKMEKHEKNETRKDPRVRVERGRNALDALCSRDSTAVAQGGKSQSSYEESVHHQAELSSRH